MELWLLVPLAIVAGIVWFAFRSPSSKEVDAFIAASGIEATDATLRFVHRYLAIGRRWRTLLVLATLLLGGALAELLTVVVLPSGVGTSDGGTSWTALLGACLVGTLWAEVRLTRPTTSTRAASLLPRDLAAYLSRPMRVAPAAVGTAAALAWAGVWALPDSSGALSAASPTDRLVGMAFGIALPALVVGAQRWILARPQPVVAPDLLAADDATRAASVRMLAGIGTAMALLNLAGAAAQYTLPANTLLDVVATGTIVVSLVLAVGFWAARKPDYLTLPRRSGGLAF
jgi:hypothetical protein